MRTAKNPVCYDDCLDVRCSYQPQHLGPDASIRASIRLISKPPLETADLCALCRHNANRHLTRTVGGRSVERNRCNGISRKPRLAFLAIGDDVLLRIFTSLLVPQSSG